MPKSLIVIPTYNEAKNLPILAAEIWAQKIPVFFEDRGLGVSKLNWSAKFEAALRTWEILWRYRDKWPVVQNSDLSNGTEGSHRDRA